ncbi:MAG: hypothetical protein WC422_00965 [Candidatus Paceibacterota bacterium]|jgi:hypothetical protein
MVELPNPKKEPIPADNNKEEISELNNENQPETKPSGSNAEKTENNEKTPKAEKVEDAHIINSKDDKHYGRLLKTKTLNEIVEVIDNKKAETSDRGQQEKMESATSSLKKLEKNVNKILEVFKKEASAEEKRKYVQSLIENENDPFAPLLEINDRRITNMATRLMLKDENINEFFVTYFGTQASFDREEWLLSASQKTGSEELKKNINDLLEKIRETRANPPEVPYFDFVDFLLRLQRAEESLPTPDTNWLEQLLNGIDVENLRLEIEKTIIDNEDNVESYGAITSFYNEYLNAGFDANALTNIDSEALKNELSNFVKDYLDVDGHKESDIQTIIEFLDKLNANESPETPDEDGDSEDTSPGGLRPHRITTTTTSTGGAIMPFMNHKPNQRYRSSSSGF